MTERRLLYRKLRSVAVFTLAVARLFSLIVRGASLHHPFALKDEAKSSKPEEFTGEPLCGGKGCFIVHLTNKSDGKTELQGRKPALDYPLF